MNAFVRLRVSLYRQESNKNEFSHKKTSRIKTRLRQVKFTTGAEGFQEKYKLAVAPLHNMGSLISGLNASN